MPALTSPTETPSPPSNSWSSVSTNLCSIHSPYERQYMTDTNAYTFPTHIAHNSPPLQQKPSIGHNYFQSEPESLSNQSESLSISPTLLTSNKSSAKKKKTTKTTYKHVPHREKPIHLVARRNARERRRVQAVNSAFVRLRKCVPVENRNKRLSKVKTLHRAIEYIAGLQDLLREADQQEGIVADNSAEQLMNGLIKAEMECTEKKFNKENRIGDQKWISIETTFNDWHSFGSYH
ncbi:unnamed protein product [Medioppia subpectinata]|uniref:BHLH domain-containing protein n=1 Tax=Medioppia subpectinata TaxID=1979941 RepID=A0A7R9L706_9ACAR|nr:unnamed protein product [Medioppia subpectinata]CAG2116620.1 unnamed protein product [Medioppia subpectinata]